MIPSCFKTDYALTLLLVLLVSSCASTEPSALKDVIVGTWCEVREDNSGCIGYVTHDSDGTFEAWGDLPEYGVSYKSSGTWDLEGDSICLAATKRAVYDIRSGEEDHAEHWNEWRNTPRYCDPVVKYDSDSMTYLDTEDGSEWLMVKTTLEEAVK